MSFHRTTQSNIEFYLNKVFSLKADLLPGTGRQNGVLPAPEGVCGPGRAPLAPGAGCASAFALWTST